MTKRALFILALTVLVSMLVATSLLAANKSVADKANGYNVPLGDQINRQLPDKSVDDETAISTGAARRTPLGTALSGKGIGPGVAVDVTYEDFQVPYACNRTVAAMNVGGNVDVHFVYEDVPNTDSGTVKRSGYNVYNATDGEWPLTSAGCLLQPSAARGGVYVGLDVMPDGFAAMSVVSDREGQYADTGATHDFWFQNLRHNCTWTQSWVPKATYQGFLQVSSRRANYPSIVTQLVGTDTILHLALRENGWTNIHGTTIGHTVIMYFRKIGSGSNGTWTNGRVIDTIAWPNTRIAAQKNGSKVAITYVNTSDSGWLNDNTWDNDIFYRESVNAGVTWGPIINVTDYSARRTTEITGAAAKDIDACYDNNGNLHIVWGAQEIMIRPYRNGQNWTDFNSDIWHWSNATGTMSKVVDGTYDPLTNIGFWNTKHCGFGPGLFESYCSKPQVSQCGDYIYVIWNQMHSKINLTLPGTADDTANAINDCAIAETRKNEANFEVFMSVSNGLAGELWDPQRNLTNTYTPNCHPDSANPDCGDEFNPSLSLEALDVTGLSLTWPSNLVTPQIPGGGTNFTSNKYLQVFYVEDKLPGSWWQGDDSNGDYPTANDMKWFRLACVEPVVAAIIDVDRGPILWPEFVQNGGPVKSYVVNVTNLGNATLNITSIAVDETSGSGWLGTSQSAMTIPAGSAGTGTFDIQITPPAAPHAPQWLAGTITINSNAANKPEWIIDIRILAADVVTDASYDTVATSTAWDGKGGMGLGDNVALVVSNYGEVGHSGEGNTNLDFNTDGNECDSTKNWYLYAASPFYIQQVGTAYNLTTSHYAASTTEQGDEESWDPAGGTVMSKGLGSHDGVSYDSVFAGKSFNRDTTVAMERTFYAPRGNTNNPSFVVTKTKLYSVGGVARNHIAFGTVTDWDIPSDSASANTSAVSLDEYVYYQGTDTGTTHCQTNLNRFGAEVVAGWYTKTAFNADPCANNTEFVGMKAVNARAYFDDTLIGGLTQPNASQWWTAAATSGYSAEPTLYDQGGFVTFLHDYTLAANDTLTFWTILATMRNGSLTQFEANVDDAKAWYTKLRVCAPTTCCVMSGNIDRSEDMLVTMGDLTVLIDHLFVTLTPLQCNREANVDASDDKLITMGDLTVLIDHLFVTLSPLPTCAQIPEDD